MTSFSANTQLEFEQAASKAAPGSTTLIRRNKVGGGQMFYEACLTLPDDDAIIIEASSLPEAEALVGAFVARGALRGADFTVNHTSPL